jgi:hypothetical protein
MTSSEHVSKRSAFPSNASPSETSQLDGDERSRLYSLSPTVKVAVPWLHGWTVSNEKRFLLCRCPTCDKEVLLAYTDQTYLEFALQSFSPIPGDCLFHSSKHFRSRRHSYDSQEETTEVRLRRGLLGRPRGDLVTKDDEAGGRGAAQGVRKGGNGPCPFPIPRPSISTAHKNNSSPVP